jgi:hypothetical protein
MLVLSKNIMNLKIISYISIYLEQFLWYEFPIINIKNYINIYLILHRFIMNNNSKY